MLQILSELKHPWITCTPSNSATDHLATVLQQKCLELGTIHFHAYDDEARAIRRQESEFACQDNPDDENTINDERKVDVKEGGDCYCDGEYEDG